jgi:hypothetical protein
MSKSERRKQLLHVMHLVYEGAKDQSEFTAGIIAKRGGVSTVLVYRRIGDEFKELRSKLPGARQSPLTVESHLRQKNAILSRELESSKDKHRVELSGDYANAIRHIESLDEENRILRGRVRILEQRLKEVGLVVEWPLSVSTNEKQVEPDAEVSTDGIGEQVTDIDGYSN